MSTKKCNIVPFLHIHTLPWYACGLSRARDQKNLCFVVVIFWVAFKRLNVRITSILLKCLGPLLLRQVSGEIN